MTAIGVALMGLAIWVMLGTADLSGGTLFGAILFLLGLWIAQSAQAHRDMRNAPMDSTDAAVDDQTTVMVEDR